jgi:mono/diheme cytochrome c family protein
MPAYATALSVTQLEDLVTFITGNDYSVPAGGVPSVPVALAPPPVVVASGATIARWLKVKHLSGAAARGAALFGKEGCLSCHRYLGSGVKRFGARDLTNGGTRRNALAYQRYVARPDRYGNLLMPGYADLGGSNLRAIGEFIAASKRKLR